MSIEELEETVSKLSPEQLSRFRQWFMEFDANHWDKALESDIANGRLDELADQAIREHRDGGSSPL